MAKSLLRQDRSRATRIAIIKAAKTLWSAEPFDLVSVKTVCNEAGVSPGLFYFYFSKKEILLVWLVFSQLAPRAGELQALLESDGTTLALCEKLVSNIGKRALKLRKRLVQRAITESFQHYPQILQMPGGNSGTMNRYFGPILERGVLRREVHKTWDLEILAITLGWAVLQGVLLWADGRTSGNRLGDTLKERMDLILGGCAGPRRI